MVVGARRLEGCVRRDYPARVYQHYVGRTVARVEQSADSDEGLRLVFADGSSLDVGFSSGYGEIKAFEAGQERKRDG